MKFRLAAAIALYVLLTLLFSTLSTTSSREKNKENSQIFASTQSNLLQNHKNRHKVFAKKWKTFFQLLVGIHKTRLFPLYLPQCKNNILFLVINQFLTCKDIIVLRQTCTDFQDLLHPNDKNMVSFCIYGPSKPMTDTNIIWKDLKYFMKENYYSAFDEMKMFNIKENEYAVLTRVPEEKYIVWKNISYPYYKMLLDETTPYTPLHKYHKKQKKVFNKDESAWAKISKKGNVITSGQRVPSQLKNVKKIFSNNYAFAALLDNGTVVAWGYEDGGGKIPHEIQTQLVNVQMIISTDGAFAALLDNGTVVAWGNKDNGGKIPYEIKTQLVNVKMIISTANAFAALLDNGTVVAWGNEYLGGKIPDEIQTQLVNVQIILSTREAFAALLDNGTVVAWGNDYGGGKIPLDIQNKMIKNVKMIFSADAAFSALLNDGTVVAWGDEYWGGKIPDEIQTHLIDVKQIIPAFDKFTALCKNGTILIWGDN